MNQLETGEAPEAAHGNSDLQKELADVLRQRAAISAVLRATANSPHDIFDTNLDNAIRLCRAEECGGIFRLAEEAVAARCRCYVRYTVQGSGGEKS